MANATITDSIDFLKTITVFKEPKKVSWLFSYKLVNLYFSIEKKCVNTQKKYNKFIDLYYEIGYNIIVNSLEVLQ